MDFAFTTATWLWLMIPMPLLIILTGISYYFEKRERNNQYEY